MLLLLLACQVRPPAPPPETPAAEEVSVPPVATVDVAVPRELRALWVATVVNLDFPSRQGLTVAELQAELDLLVDTAQASGFNALIFQVRPEGDALYESELEPWSRYLSGTQGTAPGLDPLRYLLDRAHEEGLEVHAWFNPYRAASQASAARHEGHVSNLLPDGTHRWGNNLWLDPGDPAVQDHAVRVIDDVVTRYDIDGVHLDDYFYPYPDGARSFPDDESYGAYVATGGDLTREAWRRDNVDTLVHRLTHAIRSKRPEVRFGISPFGIYRPGFPEGIRGFDQVKSLHADPMLWYRSGFIDYLAPQLYWPTTREAQRFDRLLGWWDEHSDPRRPLVAGLDFTKVGKPGWGLDEIRTQIELCREARNTAGYIGFRARPVLDDQAGLTGLLSELQATPTLPPPIGRLEREVAPPLVHPEGEAFRVEPEPRRALVVYEETARGWVVDRILPRGTTELVLGGGRWAVSQVDVGGWESPGVVVDAADGAADPDGADIR